ncbi:MAG: quinone-dependent dihydroorotate dehydrogenase [Enterobacterales bacterium]
MFFNLIKAMFFIYTTDQVHEFIMKQMKFMNEKNLEWIFYQKVPIKKIKCMGIIFKNPLGLAAGLDKNGDCINIFSAMGFGFIEIGTVTPKAQYGNLKPRIFHLQQVHGIINNLGFNNKGVDYLIENIKKSKFKGILGINVGKNKNTPVENSKNDFLICIKKVYPYASYITVNISSPNTISIDKLKFNENLNEILKAIKKQQNKLCKYYNKYVPITIKISPDMKDSELIQMADSLIKNKIDGVIATNTTINRNLVTGLKHDTQKGGLSGKPLQFRSTEVIKILSKELKGKIPIIGVGGIDSAISAREKIKYGASLIQIHSGLLFHGPKLIQKILYNI